MDRENAPIVIVFELLALGADLLEGHVTGVDHHRRDWRRVRQSRDRQRRCPDHRLSRPVESHVGNLMLQIVPPLSLGVRCSLRRRSPHDQRRFLKWGYPVGSRGAVHPKRRQHDRRTWLGNFRSGWQRCRRAGQCEREGRSARYRLSFHSAREWYEQGGKVLISGTGGILRMLFTSTTRGK